MCKGCVKVMKDNTNWYQNSYHVVGVDDCLMHPVMTNWRVVRTLKTLRGWSLDPAETAIAVGAPWRGTTRVVMHVGGGHIHERNAYLSLFDYERTFVELLIKEGYIKRHDGTPKTLTVNANGDELIRKDLAEAEAKKSAAAS